MAKENSGGNALEVAARKTLSVDSDNDGLQDWEEALWKTDPKNSDTDNDGAPDGEEVNLNRNPLKPGPNDKISAIPLAEHPDDFEKVDDNSLTSVYAKEFLTDYLTLKNQKGALSETDKENLIASFMDGILESPAESIDVYTASDIKALKDNSENAIREYSKEVKRILFEGSFISEDELVVFGHLIKSISNKKTGDEDIAKLNVTSKIYGEAASKLLLIEVPDSLANIHIETINGLNNVKLSIKEMAEFSDDPIKSITGLEIYQKEIQRVYNAIQNLQEIFNGYGISVF